MKILVTGFDPFGGERVNPAYEAVKNLPDKIMNAEIIKMEIPTVFKKGSRTVEEAIEEHMPEIVLCVGQAGGRSTLSVEKVAINLAEARIPDNEGNQPINVSIHQDGETAYFTNLPCKAVVNALLQKKIPVNVSYTAGTFVCNEVMYHLLYLINKKYTEMKGGFIHVPYVTEQVADKPADTYSCPLKVIVDGLITAIEAILQNENDIEAVGGSLS